jgi:AraC family transcriptional activator of pobA
MQTTDFAVCNIGLFGEGVRHFWFSALEGLLERFPQLEAAHRQDFFSILILEQADGEIAIDSHRIRLDRPKIIIIKPRCISSIDMNRIAKGRLICFTEDFFSLRYNNNILHQFSFLGWDTIPFARLNEGQKERCDMVLNLMSSEYSEHGQESGKVLRSYLNILLFEVERIFQTAGAVVKKHRTSEKLLQFEGLIDKYYTSKKLPSDYADMLHVSPNYLNKLCKKETGQTAGDIIRKRIAVEAQRMLHYTSLSVNEIAYKLGFENPSYFNTFFKKQTGTTPERFRNS